MADDTVPYDRNFGRLVRDRTQSNIPVKAVYGPDDVAGLEYARDIGNPGEPPFTRGLYPEMYRQNLWLKSFIVCYATPEETNRAFKKYIAAGQTGLRVLTDTATLSGVDPDHPLARYDIMCNGSPTFALSEYETMLDGIAMENVDLESANSTPSGSFFTYVFLVALMEKRGLDIGNGTEGFYEIVGVVANVHHDGLDADPAPTMYVPFGQDVFSSMWLVARTDGEPAQLAGAARVAVRGIDSGLPASRMGPLADAVSDSVAPRRFSMLLLGLFALIALFLAAVGLYGVVAYAVSQRTREIGVRMAIGAQAWDVCRLVLGGGMRLALAGVAVGTAAALALARLVASLLFEVTPFDPLSYAATALLLLAVAALACYVPASRAMRLDPLAALREE